MNDSPYVFPHLAATRDGIPDPLIKVDCWLSQWQDLLQTDDPTPDEAYDRLALWARLRRVQPELITRLNATESLAEGEAICAAGGASLAAEALTVPNPGGWLNETRALEQAFEDLGPAEDRSELAERLLNDLDDAALAAYSARRLGVADPQLQVELDRCEQWLVEHARLFLPAAVHIQAVGMALRPDLPEFDYGLAVTALKYQDLLCAIERTEQELSLAAVARLEPEVARRLAARYRDERRLQAAQRMILGLMATWYRRLRQSPLAHAGGASPLEPLWWWRWTSPAGDFTARMTIPPQPVADQSVRLEFLDVEKRRALELAGQTVTLHGATAAIDPAGKVTFPLAQLLDTDRPLILRVGPDQVEWPLTATNARPDSS